MESSQESQQSKDRDHSHDLHQSDKPLNRGFLIIFEGIDSSGKTVNARMLTESLMDRGYPVVPTHEFGGTFLGEGIREIILNSGMPCGSLAELMLIFAQREQHIQEVILPALRNKQVVVCDRFNLSTIAYQHFGMGVADDKIYALENMLTNNLKPNLVLFMDIPVEVAVHRTRAQRYKKLSMQDRVKISQDKYEELMFVTPLFLERVHRGYMRMMYYIERTRHLNWIRIPAECSLQRVQKDILASVLNALNLWERQWRGKAPSPNI